MRSFCETPPRTQTNVIQHSNHDATTFSRRRILRNNLCPRRYVIAVLLFALLVIQETSNINDALSLVLHFKSEFPEGEKSFFGNWTSDEYNFLFTFMEVSDIFASIVGALLIFLFSSYKFLLVSIILSSILHMLKPVALIHHSDIFYQIVTIGQGTVSVPTYAAVLSMWKDWAPPDERTRLLAFSFLFLVLGSFAGYTFYSLIREFTPTIFYYTGIAGIIWALFWYNISSDSPQNDPLISEREFLYLEGNIPSNIQEKIKLKDVPWKSILKSSQILILSSLFFKMACSVYTINVSGSLLIDRLDALENTMKFRLTFLATSVVALLSSSLVLDIMLKKCRNYTLNIRKCFLCGGFLLQFMLLLVATFSSGYTNVIFIILAYTFFAISVAGVFRYPLDLSSRYVSITAGIGFTFYSLGKLFIWYMNSLIGNWALGDHFDAQRYLFLVDGLLSLIIAIIFGIWGDVEEQQWSLILASNHRGNDNMCNPQPGDEDANPVSEN